jgi:hypothetical protein
MRNAILHLAAAMAMAFAGTALASDPDGIQEAEEPGSEIEIEFGDGKATIERKDGEPLFGGGGGGEGTALEPLDDPDDPVAPDPVDAELPGEGPEDLSGPDDDDPLPE